ncbi:piggyBac transposable element-derived protein 3-like [Macrosteles quadrilineatus]|uniref:piggyBac transposable element-derived protein 3-like n=1 Tax=Macrosteles quadrilineatus TaxID=74068 RepID=UPI0023E232A1|nr:piggyBac transposable element-derived protein 3-like [Macrosteles quadrilineatus]
MKNRVPDNPLKSDKDMKKIGRGAVDVKVNEDKDLCLLKWQDNKPVVMLSSNDAKEPMNDVRRWSKVDKKYIMVPQPNVIKAYNTNMGGVDLADRMLAYCPSRQRTRKWTTRTILHFLDLAISNAWLCYRENEVTAGIPLKKVPQLRKFKHEYGEYLIESSSIASESEESDWLNEDEVVAETQAKKKSVKSLPSTRFRTHGSHLPSISAGKQQRCRNPKCSKKTSVNCLRCELYLCLTADRNCFADFHK